MPDGEAGFAWPDLCERNHIGGAWRFTREGYSLDIYDPADSTVIAAVPLSTHRDIEAAMDAAGAAAGPWAALAGERRRAILEGALADLERQIDRIAAIVSRDSGLPRPAARHDTLHAIGEARARLGGAAAPAEAEPPGTIGQILSWSNPLALCLRTLVPDLAAGSTAVVHPSIRAPLAPVFLADALDRAGVPGGVFNLVQGAGRDAGAALARRPELKRLDFQGCRATADAVARSPERNGVPVRLHLRNIVHFAIDDGSDPVRAAGAVRNAAFCHGARPGCGGIVVDVAASCFDGFCAAIAAAFRAGRYAGRASGQLPGAHTIAPFIDETFRSEADRLIEEHLAAGAEPVCAAPPPDPKTGRMGWFAPARVLCDPAQRIALDPDRPNGPLVMVRRR